MRFFATSASQRRVVTLLNSVSPETILMVPSSIFGCSTPPLRAVEEELRVVVVGETGEQLDVPRRLGAGAFGLVSSEVFVVRRP